MNIAGELHPIYFILLVVGANYTKILLTLYTQVYLKPKSKE